MNLLKAFALTALMFSQAPADAATLAEVVSLNRNSVIYIRVQKAVETTGAVSEQSGTGFLLNKAGFVLTAAHLVSGGAGLQVDVRGAVGSREGNLESMEVLYENSNFDVAVVRFKNTAIQRRPVVLGDAWTVPDTATVYAMGFPGVEEWFHTEGKLSGKGPKGSWNTTLVLNPGMSGGPVFDLDGKVVAMVWGGVSTPGVSGINRVLPVNLLTDPLRLAGIASGTTSAASPPVPPEVQEVPYRFDQIQQSLGGLQAATRMYTRTFAANPGFKIVDHKYVANSANNAELGSIAVSPDGKSLTVTFALKSGPVFDQWRGWLDAQVLTRQVADK